MSRLADYLLSIALYGKVGKLWVVDSFLIEVPFGKRNKGTLKKKFELELRQRKVQGGANTLFFYIKCKAKFPKAPLSINALSVFLDIITEPRPRFI